MIATHQGVAPTVIRAGHVVSRALYEVRIFLVTLAILWIAETFGVASIRYAGWKFVTHTRTFHTNVTGGAQRPVVAGRAVFHRRLRTLARRHVTCTRIVALVHGRAHDRFIAHTLPRAVARVDSSAGVAVVARNVLELEPPLVQTANHWHAQIERAGIGIITVKGPDIVDAVART